MHSAVVLVQFRFCLDLQEASNDSHSLLYIQFTQDDDDDDDDKSDDSSQS